MKNKIHSRQKHEYHTNHFDENVIEKTYTVVVS